MADRQVYLDNTDDQISAQKRQEEGRGGSGVYTVAKVVGALAAFMIARRKLNLSRAFSSEIKATGVALGPEASRFGRYEIVEMLKDKSANQISRMTRTLQNVGQGLIAPLPTANDQLAIAEATFKKHGIKLSGLNQELFDATSRWSWWDTLRQGPIKAIAPNAPLIIPGSTLSSGAYGGISAAGKLFKLNERGAVSDIITGVRSGLAGTMGERTESLRAFGHVVQDVGSVKDFTRRVLAPDKRDIFLEHKRIHAENYIRRMGWAVGVGGEEPTTKDVIRRLSAEIDSIAMTPGVQGSRDFFKSKKAEIKQSAEDALTEIVERESKKRSTQWAYKVHKFQRTVGISEEYARGGSGKLQGYWKEFKETFGMGIEDPVSARKYHVSHRRYYSEKQSITGAWESGTVGTAYLYPSGGTAKRTAIDLVGGTFFKQFEKLTGLGVTSRDSWFTSLISHAVGAQKGSYGEFFIRNYIGGYARLGVMGAGAFLTFKTIDYLARRTTGWGVTDVAGKVYTSSREFQQKVLDHLGVVNASKKAEELFPGIINSPAARFVRATSPFWMSRVGARHSGRKGGLIGLSLGIATALITWGDLTQSPEELHRIYTGEQDIPIRKGRYWGFGTTPFGGGKIMYWRPHWYPLLRSGYKNKGQLWDSETEKLAQGSVLSPIAAPILTGKMWDPYYWEKKHYEDRPYPVTAELFEPTMPFAWLGNMTLGKLIKPQRVMHPEYLGVAQKEPGTSKTIVAGAAAQLGMETPTTEGILPVNQPSSVGWNASMAAYTLGEQAGLRGWLANAMAEKITGRPDFLPGGPVAQSASRATGIERSFWDMNIGDPDETTEFIRRVIPHRRRSAEEYNPIKNTMPDWMPGENYFINFRTGDPYVKAEMGEARLPGAGYESLHRLHSGIPKVYDAVDRFLILSDIAPYSDEYKHYRYLAEAMVKKDPYWQGIVTKHMEQRAATQQEFNFLRLNPPDDVTGPARVASTIYRHIAAGISGAGATLDPLLGMVTPRDWNITPVVMSPTSKFFPYKTAMQTYKAYRLQGSEFTNWANPLRDFLGPDIEKVKDVVSKAYGGTTIPEKEQERREYEEYFDRLQYIKFKKLERMASDRGNANLSRKFRTMAGKTMTGVDPMVDPHRIMGSIPKRERAFFTEFSEAPKSDREKILKLVSPQMARIYSSQWAMRDGEDRARNVDKYSPDQENAEFFSRHKVPDEDWAGWNPEVDIRDVQLKTVKNEGMNIHGFDLWESQERAMERRPMVPMISNIRDTEGSMENLRRIMAGQLQNDGYKNSRIYMTRTPAKVDSVNLKIKVKRDRSREVDSNIREMINA
jgi:hypothetical protein